MRCSLCGCQRVDKPDGTFGACTLLGCTDPLYDCRKEREGYPGQTYVHEHNPNIKRAELAALKRIDAVATQ